MSIDIEKYTASELDEAKINSLLCSRLSFQVVAVNNIGAVVNKIEGEIAKLEMRCRTYTEYRSASLATIFSPAAIWGLGAAAAMAAHNIATLNPDYEIAKNKVKETVTVTYKK